MQDYVLFWFKVAQESCDTRRAELTFMLPLPLLCIRSSKVTALQLDLGKAAS